MYLWLFFCGENGFDDIAVNVTNLEKLLDLASDILDIPSQDIFLFHFVDGTLIHTNESLETLLLGLNCLFANLPKKKKI